MLRMTIDFQKAWDANRFMSWKLATFRRIPKLSLKHWVIHSDLSERHYYLRKNFAIQIALQSISTESCRNKVWKNLKWSSSPWLAHALQTLRHRSSSLGRCLPSPSPAVSGVLLRTQTKSSGKIRTTMTSTYIDEQWIILTNIQVQYNKM